MERVDWANRVHRACLHLAIEHAVEAHAQRLVRRRVETHRLRAGRVERHWSGATRVRRAVSDSTDGGARDGPAHWLPWRSHRFLRSNRRAVPRARAVNDMLARMARNLLARRAAQSAAATSPSPLVRR